MYSGAMKLVPYEEEEKEELLEEGELDADRDVEESVKAVKGPGEVVEKSVKDVASLCGIEFPSIPSPTAAPVIHTSCLTTCQECNKNASKYRCPRCLFRSCSLECSRGHKQRLGCSGQRSKTHFVPVSEMGDKQVEEDANFLETLKDKVDAAERMRQRVKRAKKMKRT